MEFLYNLLIIPIISLINWLFLASLWITGSYGWAVILLSIIVKVLLLPVGLLVERLKKEELLLQQVIQPIIKDLKYKYKGEELHNKISKLYKQYSYNPIYSLKTSLGLFIQLPFFIGAFIYFDDRRKNHTRQYGCDQNGRKDDQATPRFSSAIRGSQST